MVIANQEFLKSFPVKCGTEGTERDDLLNIEAESYADACDLAHALIGECRLTDALIADLGGDWQIRGRGMKRLKVPGKPAKLENLKYLPPQSARALVAHSRYQTIKFRHLEHLSLESARTLASFSGSRLYFGHQKEWPLELINELADFEGELTLRMPEISDEIAHCLRTLCMYPDVTDDLKRMNEVVATLVRPAKPANIIRLRFLEEIAPAAAAILLKTAAQEIELGLPLLTPELAEIFAEFPGDLLFSSLRGLSEPVAKAFAVHQGRLGILNFAATGGQDFDLVAAAIVRHQGPLFGRLVIGDNPSPAILALQDRLENDIGKKPAHWLVS